MTMASPIALVAALFALTGCSAGSGKAHETSPNGIDAPQTSDAASTDEGAQTDAEAAANSTPAGPGADSTPKEPAVPKRERIRIHNSCSKQMNLRIERVNDSDTMTMLTSNTAMEERASDGDEIRLLDDKRELIHAITIQPNFKEVDIASSCTKLEGK